MRETSAATETLNVRMEAEISKLLAGTAKLIAETSRINRETSTFPWLPILITLLGITSVTGAIAALVFVFHE